MAHYTILLNKDGEVVFSPMSPEKMCQQVCAAELKSMLLEEEQLENGSKLRLKPNLKVSEEILESILAECDHCAPEFVELMQEICKNVVLGKISLKRINLNNCQFLNDSHFEEIMKIKPTSVEIHDCNLLTNKALDIINKYGENLESINFGMSAGTIISTDVNGWIKAQKDASKEWDLSLGLLNTPNLRRLTIWRLEPVFCDPELNSGPKRAKLAAGGTSAAVDFLEWITRRFVGRLEHLDLSCCGVQSLNFLLKAKGTLKFLNLNSAVVPTDRIIRWDVLAELRNLTFLDVGSCDIDDWKTSVLARIVKSLKKLTHLDISRNRLRVSKKKGLHSIDALASREKNSLQFLNMYGTYVGCRVPARVVVRDNDDFFNDLVTVIRDYREAKDLPPAVIDSLEIISKQNITEDKFPWKEAVNLLIQVAGPNLFQCYSHYPAYFVFPFVCEALKESQQLTSVQVDQVLKCVVKLLNYDSHFCVLEGAISHLPDLTRCMELWSLQNAKILVAALLQAARTAIEKCRAERESENKSGFVNDCATLLRCIGEYLSKDLSDSAVARIRALELEQEIIAVAREAREFELKFSKEGASVQYWKICDCDKIVISKQ